MMTGPWQKGNQNTSHEWMRRKHKGKETTQNQPSKKNREEDNGMNMGAMTRKHEKRMRNGEENTTMKETTTQKNRGGTKPIDLTEGAEIAETT